MGVKKSSGIIPQAIIDQYNKLIEYLPSIERKGKSLPYTSVNGHMFSFLAADGSMGLRLPEKERATFIEKYKTKLCEAHGIVLKEFVLVPEKIFKSTTVLNPWFDISLKYVTSLKPKTTTKSKANPQSKSKR